MSNLFDALQKKEDKDKGTKKKHELEIMINKQKERKKSG